VERTTLKVSKKWRSSFDQRLEIQQERNVTDVTPCSLVLMLWRKLLSPSALKLVITCLSKMLIHTYCQTKGCHIQGWHCFIIVIKIFCTFTKVLTDEHWDKPSSVHAHSLLLSYSLSSLLTYIIQTRTTCLLVYYRET
jgi:hypothetical protein